MEISKIKKALIDQKNMNLKGNLYHKTQLDFAYNTNHIEGSTITPDETASIYDTGTILATNDKVIVLLYLNICLIQLMIKLPKI